MSEAPVSEILDWPLPRGVRAFQTERGARTGWGFNLAAHVGAPQAEVAANRARLAGALPPSVRLQFLEQVHGTAVARLPASVETPVADAAVTAEAGVVCAVLTADCLPILLCDDAGSVVAAVHAGWRGLAAGVIDAAVAAMSVPASSLRAWLGPRIGPQAFEVGPEVAAAILERYPGLGARFTVVSGSDRRRADLGGLAADVLLGLGVSAITDSLAFTDAAPTRWYSFRREGRCGRMASLILRVDSGTSPPAEAAPLLRPRATL